MNLPLLALRSFLFRWRTNLAVAAGTALAAAVLVGSLGAGDTVRAGLRRIAMERVGAAAFAMETEGRFFRQGLADGIAAHLGGRGAALLASDGSTSARGGGAQAAPVRILGVDAAFWALGPGGPMPDPGPDGVYLNGALARRLGAGPGDEVLLRAWSASSMPGEAPLSTGSGSPVALRLTVRAVLSARDFGDFSLRVGQEPPLNAFLSRDALARRIGREGRANAVLLDPPPHSGLADVRRALARAWRMEDAGLSLRKAGRAHDLLSDRVFLEPPVAEAALAEGGRGILTYFVDRIASGDRSIPYSFVSAGAGGGPELGEGEAALNQWAAGELSAGVGDAVDLTYRVPGTDGRLETRSARFLVRAVVAIEDGDRDLMPPFPGLSGFEDCRDWEPGVPIDVTAIRDRDEAYWKAYGGSPKAFLAMPSAQRLWSNRFGSLTAVRFPDGGDMEALAARVTARLDPGSLEFSFTPVRDIGLAAGAQGVDFGQLFLGLSSFLIAASVLLTGLLFLLSVEQRRADIGLLTAVGFPAGRIRGVLLAEGAMTVLSGSAAGIPAGFAFLHLILAGLGGAWRDAVRTPALSPRVEPGSLALGFLAASAAGLAAIAIASRGLLRAGPARNLRGAPAGRAGVRRTRRIAAACASACAVAGGIALLVVPPPAGFFTAGTLLLAAFLCGAWLILARRGGREGLAIPSVAALGFSNAARRRTQSMAVVSILACGVFLVVAVAANRIGVTDPESRRSGTGGFAFLVETAVPLDKDPAVRENRRALRLDAPELAEGRFVGFRVLDGGDASCLNLNRVPHPRILAVDPARLSGSFSPSEDPWALLAEDLGPDTIPALADRSVITWGLGLRIGDELEYADGRGGTVKVRLVAGLADSVLQGSLVVGESAFLRHFPSSSGYRFFLLDAAPDRRAEVLRVVGRSLERYGVSVTACVDRLAQLHSVENAYLSIFALLGWLGMMVGTLGLAAVAARNVAEARGELALLSAVGFPPAALVRLVIAAHLPPLGLGLAAGAAASAIAVVPAATLAGQDLPVARLLVLLAALAAASLGSVAAAALLSLRRDPLPALRRE